MADHDRLIGALEVIPRVNILASLMRVRPL
jgi:hypothetical protein